MNRLKQDAEQRLQLTPRGVLRCLLLVFTGLLPFAAPGFGLRGLVECEAFLDEAAPSEAVTSRLQIRSQTRNKQSRAAVLPTAQRKVTRVAVSDASRVSHRGHRLPNNLMAPLRL